MLASVRKDEEDERMFKFKIPDNTFSIKYLRVIFKKCYRTDSINRVKGVLENISKEINRWKL